MPRKELEALAQGAYGQQWQSALARDMDIGVRTVSRWAAAGIGKALTAERVRSFLAERRLTKLVGPGDGLTVEDVLGPRIEALLAAAEAAGWDRAEAAQAVADAAGKIKANAPFASI